jgi:hypothetical protein
MAELVDSMNLCVLPGLSQDTDGSEVTVVKSVRYLILIMHSDKQM